MAHKAIVPAVSLSLLFGGPFISNLNSENIPKGKNGKVENHITKKINCELLCKEVEKEWPFFIQTIKNYEKGMIKPKTSETKIFEAKTVTSYYFGEYNAHKWIGLIVKEILDEGTYYGLNSGNDPELVFGSLPINAENKLMEQISVFLYVNSKKTALKFIQDLIPILDPNAVEIEYFFDTDGNNTGEVSKIVVTRIKPKPSS